jgi:hypothetical protein
VYDFDTFLNEAREHVNRALNAVLDGYLKGVDDWLTEPIRYACEGGGKRFRAILFLASYEVSGRAPDERVRRLATALEIVHAYSLVHDDLPCMDDDDWRRGRPTCHRAFGTERATIAAAAMVPLASWVVAEEAQGLGLSAAESAVLVAELSEAAGPQGMVGGQVLDLISAWALGSGAWSHLTCRRSATTANGSASPSRSPMTSWTRRAQRPPWEKTPKATASWARRRTRAYSVWSGPAPRPDAWPTRRSGPFARQVSRALLSRGWPSTS